MSQDRAEIDADSLLTKLVLHQPQLFAPVVPNGATQGKNLAETIKALRDGLIEMYRATPT